MMKEKEKKLVIELRKNGRQDITKLASMHGYPKSTMYDILHKLERKGILEHTTKVDFEKLGFPIRIFMMVKTSPQHKAEMKEFLMRQKNVNSIYTVNHSANFHFEAIFRNQKGIEEFLEALEAKMPLTQINVYNVIEKICSEKFLTEEEHFE